MKATLVAGCVMLSVVAVPAWSQVAGSTKLGTAELHDIAIGWSAKKQILRKPVYNENNQRVGTIDDIIVTPEGAVSYAIVGAGGFVGMGKHDVAIRVDELHQQDGKIVLQGATKNAIKSMPAFEYAKSR